MSDIAIRVEHLTKEFQIGKKRSGDFRENFGHSLQQLVGGKSDQTTFKALNDISFEIKKGEAVGIIGRNGAGKSTLLKVLSRITEPTKGRIEINGRVSSLLEVGTGFHPELTGRENIYLNGTILGMTRREVKAKFDEIIDFSGVEKFIDTPVKHYSSGMKVRLAFSVAAHLEPEILIVDEVLAVGDAEFQKKCLGKMDDVSKKQGRTVVFVSHNMGAVQSLCNTGLLIENGELKFSSMIDAVVDNYVNKVNNKTAEYITDKRVLILKKFEMLNAVGDQISTFNTQDSILIRIKYHLLTALNNISFAICFDDQNTKRITSLWTLYNGIRYSLNSGDFEINFNIKSIKLIPGSYQIVLFVESDGEVIQRVDNFMNIVIGYSQNRIEQQPIESQGLYIEEFNTSIIHD